MGQRANLAIGSKNSFRLYYDHWCANSLDKDLFWGPDHAVAFIEQLAPVGEDGWLDEVWCEGAALLDPKNKTLLFFGGEDILHEIHLRREHLKLMAGTWPGWRIEWAREGILSIAKRLGLPHERFVSASDPHPFAYSADFPEDNNVVLTRRTRDGAIEIRRVAGDSECLECGPAGLAEARRSPVTRTLTWEGDMPGGGVHIDEARRRIGCWWAPPRGDSSRPLRSAWPGWEIVWWGDRFEPHVEVCDGALRFPDPDESLLRGRIAQTLWWSLERNKPRNPLPSLLPTLEEHIGPVTEINPLTNYARDTPDVASKRVIWEKLFASDPAIPPRSPHSPGER